MADLDQRLRQRLHESADDTDRPLRTDAWDLLDRARDDRRRRRRRALGGAVAAAALVAGLAVGADLLSSVGHPAPAPSERPTTSATPTRTPALRAAQVISRCRPQLAKYGALPMYPRHPERAHLRLARPWSYRPGDLVALSSRQGNDLLCRVPAADHEDDPVPFSAYDPAPDDSAAVAERCAQTRSGSGVDDDVRGAEVLVVDAAKPGLVALLGKGGRYYACSLQPVTWDAGLDDLERTGNSRLHVWLDGTTTGFENKSVVRESASYFFGAGLVDRRVRTIRLRTTTGVERSWPVRDGRYAILFRAPGAGGLPGLETWLYDGRGRLLGHQPPEQ
jgi:hypothetical protein